MDEQELPDEPPAEPEVVSEASRQGPPVQNYESYEYGIKTHDDHVSYLLEARETALALEEARARQQRGAQGRAGGFRGVEWLEKAVTAAAAIQTAWRKWRALRRSQAAEAAANAAGAEGSPEGEASSSSPTAAAAAAGAAAAASALGGAAGDAGGGSVAMAAAGAAGQRGDALQAGRSRKSLLVPTGPAAGARGSAPGIAASPTGSSAARGPPVKPWAPAGASLKTIVLGALPSPPARTPTGSTAAGGPKKPTPVRDGRRRSSGDGVGGSGDGSGSNSSAPLRRPRLLHPVNLMLPGEGAGDGLHSTSACQSPSGAPRDSPSPGGLPLLHSRPLTPIGIEPGGARPEGAPPSTAPGWAGSSSQRQLHVGSVSALRESPRRLPRRPRSTSADGEALAVEPGMHGAGGPASSSGAAAAATEEHMTYAFLPQSDQQLPTLDRPPSNLDGMGYASAPLPSITSADLLAYGKSSGAPTGLEGGLTRSSSRKYVQWTFGAAPDLPLLSPPPQQQQQQLLLPRQSGSGHVAAAATMAQRSSSPGAALSPSASRTENTSPIRRTSLGGNTIGPGSMHGVGSMSMPPGMQRTKSRLSGMGLGGVLGGGVAGAAAAPAVLPPLSQGHVAESPHAHQPAQPHDQRMPFFMPGLTPRLSPPRRRRTLNGVPDAAAALTVSAAVTVGAVSSAMASPQSVASPVVPSAVVLSPQPPPAATRPVLTIEHRQRSLGHKSVSGLASSPRPSLVVPALLPSPPAGGRPPALSSAVWRREGSVGRTASLAAAAAAALADETA